MTPIGTTRARLALIVALLEVAIAPGVAASAAPTVVLPPPDGWFDYQLGGAYVPSPDVVVVSRDRTARPVPGVYSICYVNAFQTQPGERGFWTGSRRDLLLTRADGRQVMDPGYPGEILLDTRSDSRRARIATIVDRWFAGCARRGFRAVDPDNLDSWTRSERRLTRAGNIALATLLVRAAHARGLAIAQKNTSELSRSGSTRIGFDFAVAEECHVHAECGAYIAAYGRRVYEIEYVDNGGVANFAAACADHGARISITYRDRGIVPAGAAGHVYRSC